MHVPRPARLRPSSRASVSTSPEHSWWLAPAPAGNGLDSDEAARRRTQFGPNEVATTKPRALVWQFLLHFRNPLVAILLAASLVSALAGNVGDFAIIAVLVLASVALDFALEHRASHAAHRLRASMDLRATVERDGSARELAVAELVPGDLIRLSAGQRVPADARVTQARDFFVNQGLLTGESVPVEKAPAVLANDAIELQQATNAVFMGCQVVSGSARAVVVATGGATALGAIAHEVQAEAPPTAFEVDLHRFSLLLMRLTLLLVLFVLLANVVLMRPLLESFLFAVALAVGLTPELLPMVVSVTLARAALRLARRRVIVKRLAAVQNLGAMDVLCTDKTGTLTEARITLERCVGGDGAESARVLLLAHLNSVFESGLKSPLDEAILARPLDASDWSKIDEVPFDFERRRVSVLVARGNDRWLIVKGASDDVLALCDHVEHDEGRTVSALDDAARRRLRASCRALESEGLRVLAVAWREVPADHGHATVGDESNLVFAGFAAFIDPPKPGAAEALNVLARSGVKVKVVSGDSELVALHLARQLNLRVAGVLTGREIAALDDGALRAHAARTTIFARVNPSQKARIIRALRHRGHVVGYLGDGVNDAPPLRAADVGLSVDSAVDVARECADIVLLGHDLTVVHEAVIEGRRSCVNVLKYVMMGTSSNLGNMLSMAGAALVLPFLPLLPVQILLNNLLYDLSQSTIPLDRVDVRELRRPRALDLRFIRRYMLVFGTLSSVFDALTFWLLLAVLHANEAQFRSGWFVESLVTQVLVVFVIRTRGVPWASRPAAALAAASLAVAGVALALPFTPLAPLVHLVPLPAAFYAWLAPLVALYLALAELAKRFFYRHVMGPSSNGHPVASAGRRARRG